jgi:UDP-N-acetylglucosamine transferase subunit ALG13
MIFVTVGSMMPFDRLIETMDKWASNNGTTPTFAQIGDGSEPRHMQWARRLAADEFSELVTNSTVVVAHAGMGSIISAAEAGKAIVIMPRYASLKEHTTDHQVHTARRLIGRPGIYVAMSEAELPERINEAFSAIGSARPHIPRTAPDGFVAAIRAFLLDGVSPTQLNRS